LKQLKKCITGYTGWAKIKREEMHVRVMSSEYKTKSQHKYPINYLKTL